MNKRVVFGTSSWGLGHATRDLALMRALLDAGCELTVVATGDALRVLKGELGERAAYLDWPDMPTSVAKTSAGFYAKTVANIPKILGTWFAEKARLKRLLREQAIDVVISDHRYGLVTDRVPSFFISHSPRYIAPWRSPFMEAVMEWFIARWLLPVRAVLIPDDERGGLSGDMGHKVRFLPPAKRVYLGVLSSLERHDIVEDVDAFITISGPEPQRTQLERTLLAQLDRVEGKVVLALGKPGRTAPDAPPGVTVHPYLDRAGQAEMMNRARLVVCRSGYTTLMELVELGKRALLIPTPGQSEQEYLAHTLRERGLYHSVKQRELDLTRDLELARACPGYHPAHPTRESVRRFLDVVLAQ